MDKDLDGVDLSQMAGAELNQLAYKSMPLWIYVSTTILLYALEVYLSIVIDNIGNVFGFIGTIAGTSLSFFIPYVLFCRGYSMFASDSFMKENACLYRASVVNFIVGIGFFGLFLYANILSLQG